MTPYFSYWPKQINLGNFQQLQTAQGNKKGLMSSSSQPSSSPSSRDNKVELAVHARLGGTTRGNQDLLSPQSPWTIHSLNPEIAFIFFVCFIFKFSLYVQCSGQGPAFGEFPKHLSREEANSVVRAMKLVIFAVLVACKVN